MRKRTKGVAVALASVAVLLFFFLAPVVAYTFPQGCLAEPPHGSVSLSYHLFGFGAVYNPTYVSPLFWEWSRATFNFNGTCA
jgi:hypothetical protein